MSRTLLVLLTAAVLAPATSAEAAAQTVPGIAPPFPPGGEAIPAATYIDHTRPADMPGRDEGYGFYRDPTLRGEILVFQAEGDLWRVPVAGGVARRLTTHPGEESDPMLSPDGTTLAFQGTYEGPAELYTMPAEGGRPTRRTYDPEASTPSGWTPDGRITFMTNRFATLPRTQLVTLDPATGALERVPLAEASQGAWADDGTLFFERPAFHGNVTKRYRGGTARDVWRFDGPGDEAVELTGDYDGESHSPMPWNGRVYFVTDRDGTMNLWSMTPDGGDLRQHTRHSGMDVRDPELDDGRIVYNVGADLWLYDARAETVHRIPITLATDLDHLRERWVTDPMEYLTSVHVHPEGKSVVLTSRGRVFVAPAGSGRLVRASREGDVRYRDVVFTPDGEHLIGLSDETGELEFVHLPADGVGEADRLTDGGSILRFRPVPSPGGEFFAYTDNNRDLWLLRADGTPPDGATDPSGLRISESREGVGELSWSPDGRYLAYRMTDTNSFARVKIYDTETGATLAVTSDRVNSTSPAWSADGEHLFFLSDRNLRTRVGSPWGTRQPEPYFDETMEVYVVALEADGDSPFRPTHELMEAGPTGDEPKGGSPTDASRTPDAASAVSIDGDGLAMRVWRVPVESGNYFDLTASEGALFWVSRPYGEQPRLMALEIGRDAEPVEVAEGVGAYEMSADRKKLMLRKGPAIHIVDARPGKADLSDSAVDLDGWTFRVDPSEDWRQIYVDAWRLERDYFYDPEMHGVDWVEIRDRYAPLVDRVTTRDELSDVIGRVVGELSALHTSVRGGDLREGPDDVEIGSLGARLVRNEAAGGYVIEHVYRHDPDYPDERSPLADPATGISEGDAIVAVNGRPTLDAPDIGALLRGQAGEQVLLTVRPAEGGEDFEAVVVALGSEFGLRYTDWEVTRRERVEEEGGGALGYVHLRAMTSSDVNDWYERFYPVFDRQGLIVDVRSNRGGNIDSFILEKLLREAWMYWKTRVGENTWNMQYAFRGHLVVLVDQETASDGEAFADGFRRLGLGPVIGMRTWGGEIWLSSVNRLSDGGLARAPMMGVYGPEGEWLIEQIGVVPDVEVDNLPHAAFHGEDAQLDTAIAYLLGKIEEDPRGVPAAPAYPDRSFEYPTEREGGAASGGGEGR